MSGGGALRALCVLPAFPAFPAFRLSTQHRSDPMACPRRLPPSVSSSSTRRVLRRSRRSKGVTRWPTTRAQTTAPKEGPAARARGRTRSPSLGTGSSRSSRPSLRCVAWPTGGVSWQIKPTASATCGWQLCLSVLSGGCSTEPLREPIIRSLRLGALIVRA